MRRPILTLTLLPALVLAGCEAPTSPGGSQDLDTGSTAPPAGAAFTPGDATPLTTSGADRWPALEGDQLAWYRSAPADEEGLWVMDLGTGQATRAWAGTIRSSFDLRDGVVYWGSDTALMSYDITTGETVVLTSGFRDYRDVSAGARYITGSAVQSSRRPLVVDRVSGEARLVPTPTSVPAARGWEDHILWTDSRRGVRYGDFYLLHIPTGTETRVSGQDELLSAANSALADGRAVYFARRFCPGPLEVYDLVSGSTDPIPLPAPATCPGVAGLLGDLLAYRYDAGGGVLQLGFQDLATGDNVEFSVARPASGRVDVGLDGTRAVYSSAAGLVLVDLRFRAPPVADAGGPYTVPEGTPLTLDGTASAASDGTPLAFAWTLDDGASLDPTPTPTHVWADDGAYRVRLTVTDQAGLEASAEASVEVGNLPPMVFLGSPGSARSAGSRLTAETGQPVTLEAHFSDAGLQDAPWSWEVSWDGGLLASGATEVQGSLPPVTWTPARPGEWTVRVQVRDKDGGVAEVQIPVSVSEAVPDLLPLVVAAGSGANSSVPAPGSAGVFAVTVFGTGDFAVEALDVSTLRLAPGGAAALTAGGPKPAISDVDGDGHPDLRVHFRARELDLEPGPGVVCLTGATVDGQPVEGCAPVRVAGG